MKYIAIVFGLVACNAPSSSNDLNRGKVTPVSRSANAPEVARADSIVPPQYDAQGRLLRLERSDSDWKQGLNAMEYRVLRQEGTEYAFSGDLWDKHDKGTFICRGCGLPLFASSTKFDSGTGWPSFWQPIKPGFVTENRDDSHGMARVEVECARCGGHLGHVFDDGPKPTGLRYCINSASLDFVAN